MRDRSLLFALVTGGMLLAASPALAQDSTTGAVKGIILDDDTGNPVAGATVVVSGENLQGTQAEITDSSGTYYIANLPPGNYLITVYYANVQFERPDVVIRLGKTAQVNIPIKPSAGEGEKIIVEGRAPLIDQGSTKTGRTITPDYTQNIPTGRTFGDVLEAAGGSANDFFGASFGGSTSAENTYIVEGLNTTDPAFGLISTNLPNEFIQETEVITGGYNAEYGRATGGVINIVTKSGSNEFHGSVYSYFTPARLVASEVAIARADTAITFQDERDYSWDVGAEVGGPIIKDRLWFHVGFNPSVENTKYHRVIKSRRDVDGDEQADLDTNGFIATDEVGRTTRDKKFDTYYFTAKLTGQVTSDHQGSIAFLGNPESQDDYTTIAGVDSGQAVNDSIGATDISAKWTSKFNNNKTQIDLVAGYHNNYNNRDPRDEIAGQTPLIQQRINRSLFEYNDFETRDFGGVPEECLDDTMTSPNPNDKSPGITNCPVNRYNIGGTGFLEDRDLTRTSAQLSLTQRVKAAGHHEIKVGADFENQRYDHLRQYTGGGLYFDNNSAFTGELDGFMTISRWYRILGQADQARIGQTDMVDVAGIQVPVLIEDCGDEDLAIPCRSLPEGQADTGTTRNYSVYLRDSWQVLPNLTLNAGVRWEQQNILVADELKGTFNWTSMEPIDAQAITLSNMIAPRLGAIYDPTQEGRSKLYGHWGRFYESVPMDINSRAFGGEVINIRRLNTAACPNALGPDSNVTTFRCSESADDKVFEFFLGGGTEPVVPNLKGQYIDEWTVGGEYELLNNLKVGAALVHRSLGRAIEDISIDGGTTYVIANPGEIDEQGVMDQLANGEIDADTAQALLSAKEFDTPTRNYDALQLTAEKRFTRNLMVLATYTYSRLRGNFPGLFSPETNQLDPNLTSMYDLPELMANRSGALPHDRPHNFKLDGYYQLDAEELGFFNFGASIRAVSGVAHNVLGRHVVYGAGETYLLGRDFADRSPFTTRFDVQAAYGYKINKDVSIQAFLQVFNVFNQQPGTDVDEIYTDDVVNPIVGGDQNDIDHAKELAFDQDTGFPLNNSTVTKSPNFGNINARQEPLRMTLGVRLTF